MKLKRLFLVFLFTVLYIGQSFLTPVEASAATISSGLVLMEDTGGVAFFPELAPSSDVQSVIFEDLARRDSRINQLSKYADAGTPIDYILSATMVSAYSDEVSGYRLIFARQIEQLSLLDDVILVNVRVANGADMAALEASSAPIPSKDNAVFGMNNAYIYGYNYDATGSYVSTIYRPPAGGESEGVVSLTMNYATKPWVNYGNRIIFTNAENAGNVSPWAMLEGYEAPDDGAMNSLMTGILKAIFEFFDFMYQSFLNTFTINADAIRGILNGLETAVSAVSVHVVDGLSAFFSPFFEALDILLDRIGDALDDLVSALLNAFLALIFPSQEQWGEIQEDFRVMMSNQFGVLFEVVEILVAQLNPMLVEFDEVKVVNLGKLFGSPMVIDLGALEKNFPEAWLLLVSSIRLLVWSRIVPAFFRRAVSILNGATAGTYDDLGATFVDGYELLGVDTKSPAYSEGLSKARNALGPRYRIQTKAWKEVHNHDSDYTH